MTGYLIVDFLILLAAQIVVSAAIVCVIEALSRVKRGIRWFIG